MIQEGYLKSFKCILSDFEKKSEQLLWSLGPVCHALTVSDARVCSGDAGIGESSLSDLWFS